MTIQLTLTENQSDLLKHALRYALLFSKADKFNDNIDDIVEILRKNEEAQARHEAQKVNHTPQYGWDEIPF